jgi:hypothetical protein
MAEAASIRTMLERMGFTPEAAQLVTGDQGIDSVDELRNLDDDKASNLCRVLRRPGGTNAAGAADPGTKVSARAEDNLKLAIYYVKHQDRVSRAVNVGEITLTNVRKLIKQRDTERNHTDPDTPPVIDCKDWPKTMEAVEEYLRQFRGVNDVPLSYVVRIALAPKPAVTDPATNYLTLDEEMIARAPILVPGTAGIIADLEVNGPFTESFMTDRTTAWDKIAVLFQNHEAWTYAKPARRTRNGRAGFFGVYNHFLGPNNVDHMASKAERRLRDVNYHGEKRNWTFEKYVTVHKEQHHVLTNLEQHGYKGIDDRSKVRFLIDGIKTTRLDTVKATILSSDEYRADFDKCVTLYKDFIKQSDGQLELKIAAVHFGGEKSDGSGSGKSAVKDITDRYYKKEEYKKLSTEQKQKLFELRKKRKKGVTFDDSTTTSPRKKISALKAKNAALEAKIAKLESKTEQGSDMEMSDDDSEQKPSGNRSHSALTRQKKRKS